MARKKLESIPFHNRKLNDTDRQKIKDEAKR
jgi:hypothetical protein